MNITSSGEFTFIKFPLSSSQKQACLKLHVIIFLVWFWKGPLIEIKYPITTSSKRILKVGKLQGFSNKWMIEYN